MDKIKSYFERYPNSNEVFENGGKLFHNQGAAESFGQGETTKYTREQVEKSADGPASKDEIILQVKEIEDFSTIPTKQLREWAKILEIKLATNTNAVLFKAFSDFKETLKEE